MNTGYLIYQAERTRSAAGQREVNVCHAELAASFARLWHVLAGPRRSRHRGHHRPAQAACPSARVI